MDNLSIFFEKNICLITYLAAILIFILGMITNSIFLISFGMITGFFLISYFNISFSRRFIESLF